MKNHKLLLVVPLLVSLGAYALNGDAKPKSAGKSSAAANDRHARGEKLRTPAYIQATQLYTDKKYSEAMKAFQALDKSGLCCDMVHYYIALCYQHTNQIQPALQNYNYVMTYSNDNQLRAYANSASAQLSKYQQNRTYEGNGNNFIGQSAGGGGGGGGGGGSSGG